MTKKSLKFNHMVS